MDNCSDCLALPSHVKWRLSIYRLKTELESCWQGALGAEKKAALFLSMYFVLSLRAALIFAWPVLLNSRGVMPDASWQARGIKLYA